MVIHFDLEDPGIPHDVSISNKAGAQLFHGDIITGVASTDYHVPQLPAGSYTIVCVVHPTVMTATLTVR